MHILVVDDEPNIRRTLRITLEAVRPRRRGGRRRARRRSARPSGGRATWPWSTSASGGESGLDLLETLAAGQPRLAGVVITAHASVATAVEAMRRGAFDYLPKPFTPDAGPRGARAGDARDRGLTGPRGRPGRPGAAGGPRGRARRPRPGSPAGADQARVVAPTEAAVLIRGESGTGKGVLARALHAWSKRADGPFVTVSCPSLSPELLESDLFGHASGAVHRRGPRRRRQGRRRRGRARSSSTRSATCPPPLQPKLLRFLQERKYERVGETVTRTADVRLVAATNRDLEAAVASGAFREDLLYRLNVIELTLPPLRLRSDIGRWPTTSWRSSPARPAAGLTGFTPEAREALTRHAWPGNLRELRNAVERAAILAAGPEVGLADLPERIAHPAGSRRWRPGRAGRPVSLERLEVEHIRRVLAAAPSLDEAARVLEHRPEHPLPEAQAVRPLSPVVQFCMTRTRRSCNIART